MLSNIDINHLRFLEPTPGKQDSGKLNTIQRAIMGLPFKNSIFLCVFRLYMYLHTTCFQDSLRPEDSDGSSGMGVTDSCELQCWC